MHAHSLCTRVMVIAGATNTRTLHVVTVWILKRIDMHSHTCTYSSGIDLSPGYIFLGSVYTSFSVTCTHTYMIVSILHLVHLFI